ncbi:MAG: hypothetical protein ACI9OJ_005018 [Myxococcota bacterium]|jgi:hypothetical protein
MGKRKKKTPPKKKTGGSLSNMRGGFQGMFGGKKGGKGRPSEVQFFKIAAALFAVGAIIFFASR